MKGLYKSVLLLLFLTSILRLEGQSYCKTVGDRNSVGLISDSNRNNPTGPFYIRVYFHTVRNGAGFGGQTLAAAQQAFAILNANFNPHNIFFVWNDCALDFIDDNDLFNFNDNCADQDVQQLFATNAHADGIDIYLLDDGVFDAGVAENIVGNALIVGGTGGWQVPPFGAFVTSHVISHEMGHCLGLWHTHHGTFPEIGTDCAGNPVGDFGECAELVNGSNADVCGDYVTDTPADPHIMFNVNNTTDCEWTGAGNDANGDPFNPDERNLMAYTHVACMSYFTNLQGERMRCLIDAEQILQDVLWAPPTPPAPLEITGIVNWNNPMDVESDVIIKTGSQLTVTNVLGLGFDRKIIVERGARLIIDGGTVTRGCNNPLYWGSISVSGNSLKNHPNPFANLSADDPGVVILRDATLEFGRHAISTRNANCPDCWEFFGGLVDAENSLFRNCHRAAEFMKYDLYNRSKFVNCTFTDDIPGEGINLGAVSIWDTEPILFDHCTFGYMDKYAILAYDAACTVKNGCIFKGNNRAIQYFATAPVSGGEILRIEPLGGAPNVFENNDWLDIELHSSSFYKNTRIVGNQFKGTYDGIWIDGYNSANIRNNYFSGKDFAISGQFTANGNNYIYCNDISNDIFLPILFDGNNQRTRFLKNLLESELVDVAVSESSSGVPGSLHPSQGSGGYPAHNCFSIINQEHIWTLGQTVSFNYDLPYNPQSCETPQPSSNGSDNYNLIPTNEPIFEDCPLLDDDEEESYVYTDYTNVKQQYLALKAQLNSDPNNTQLLNQVLQKEEEKENIVAWFVRDAINNGNVSVTETILAEEGTDNANRLRYGLRVQLNDYAGAHSILNTLPSLTQDEQWFKSVQEINLERLQNPLNFILSASQDSLLNEVAFSQSSERSYARALLSFLKGTQFSPDFEVPQRNRSSRPNPPSLIKKDLNKVSIHPNPANSHVEVVLADVQAKPTDIIISGFSGKILRTFHFDNGAERYNIPLEGLPAGMYFLQIKSPEKVIGRTRLVVSR